MVGMIWAEDRNRAIGTGTRMLWRVPDDFRYFRSRTHGHPVVMGRASWEALGRALPGRRNIVITRQPGYEADGADVVGSLEEGLALARDSEGGELVWIIGGGQVYREGLAHADLLVVSEVDLDASTGVEPVVYAPEIDERVWERDDEGSDRTWRPHSGDARWRVHEWRRH